MVEQAQDIVISGMGVCSSLGSARQAAAAFRGGLVRPRELAEWRCVDEETNDVMPLIGHPITPWADGFEGVGRLVRMGAAALRDLVEYAGLRPEEARRSGLLLAMPDLAAEVEDERPASRPPDEPALLGRLSAASGIAMAVGEQKCWWEGRIGFLKAIEEGVRLLREGKLERCIVGGIDTHLTPERMRRHLQEGTLHGPNNPAGLSPGEAAALVMLESQKAVERRRARKEALLRAPVIRMEENDRSSGRPPSGGALAQATLAALKNANLTDAQEGDLFLDQNGDTFRANDWGMALVKTVPYCRIAGWTTHYPATSFGDTGAASGALALCLAVRSFVRHYARTSHALVALASERGGRGAVVTTRQNGKTGVS